MKYNKSFVLNPFPAVGDKGLFPITVSNIWHRIEIDDSTMRTVRPYLCRFLSWHFKALSNWGQFYIFSQQNNNTSWIVVGRIPLFLYLISAGQAVYAGDSNS